MTTAAAELFSHHGYQHTNLAEVARLARCAASTIRQEFGGKAGLLEEVIRASGICQVMPAPNDSGRFGLEEVIGLLTDWEVNRIREQRKCLQAMFPLDNVDAAVLQVAGKLSFFGSTEILHDRFRKHRLGEVERQFLVYTIQAVGFRLGWSRFEKLNQVAPHVKQIARTLAGGLKIPPRLGR
jgi:AcrR family transcriptional regulator